MADSDAAPSLEDMMRKFKALEAVLEPVLGKPLMDSQKDMDALEKAKDSLMLAYLVYDLIWMYLRVKGIDPISHPVIDELERVKQSFAKVKDAESAKPTMRIDKSAAARFIKAAVTNKPAATHNARPQPTTSTVDTSTRFAHLSQPSPVQSSSAGSSVDSDLEVFEGLVNATESESVSSVAGSDPQTPKKDKKKKKRKREAEEGQIIESSPSQETDESRTKRKKKKKRKSAVEDGEVTSTTGVIDATQV